MVDFMRTRKSPGFDPRSPIDRTAPLVTISHFIFFGLRFAKRFVSRVRHASCKPIQPVTNDHGSFTRDPSDGRTPFD